MRKVWDIPGGVHPPENKSQSNQTPIASISLPREIVLPLSQHIGAEAIPTVQIGDHVKKGQRIADAQGVVSAAIHASSSGIVTAIEQRPIPHASGMSAQCIVIALDGKEEWGEKIKYDDYKAIEPRELVAHIRNCGIAGMGGAGFPTAVKLSPRANQKITTLILNGTECEPYITADDVLMRERAEEIIAGAELLTYILGDPEEIIIGIEDNKPEAITTMQKAAEGSRVEIVSFPTKYPSGGEKQLIQILTGKEVPTKDIPASVGIVVQNIATAAAAYRAVVFGEPLISRVTTVVGESLQTQQNIDVLLGTPINHILEEHHCDTDNSARLIIGGPMMGYAMDHDNIPVVKTTNCILVPSRQEMPAPAPAQPCIRCGMCSEACPASLLPQQLFWFSQSEDVDKLQSHNLFDCIECGACSYVCPSNIPLVQYYRASKGMIKKLESDKHKSDRSRDRFEFRQERIAKADAEKEAKRAARKKAAEEAKKKLAEKSSQDAGKPEAKNDSDLSVKTKPETKIVDPSVQLKKLERAVSSAKSRVERATKQLNTAKEEGDSARLESLEARLKQAELNLQEAEKKLAENGTITASADQTIKTKIALNPTEKQEKTIATLKQRIATAEQKHKEAVKSDSPTASALQMGLEKLRQKLIDAEKSLAEIAQQPAGEIAPDTATVSAADAAIAKAQAKAAEMASMSDEEKAQAQIASLKTRLEKAKVRLEKAEAENSEHIDAFRAGVEKLEKKLSEANA
ncbi:MAG: electron transport complex subunit RsxC [Agarilytica sp.]